MADRRAVRRAQLVALALLLIPFNLETTLTTAPGFDDVHHRVSVFPYDVPLLLLALMAAPDLLRTARRRVRLTTACVVALAIWTAVSLGVNPSLLGLRTLLRLVEAGALAHAVTAVARSGLGGHVAVPLALQSVFQLVVATLQVARDASLPTPLLGGTNLFSFTPVDAAGQGTFPHPYQLAGFAAVSATFLAVLAVRRQGRQRVLLALAAAAAAACLGLSYSRSSAVALALVLAAAVLAALLRRPGARAALGAAALVVLAAVTAGLAAPGAWTARIDQVTALRDDGSQGSVDAATSGRVALTKEGLELSASRPVTGVGPGQYLIALQEAKGAPDTQPLLPVHNVPIMLAAETGVVGGLLGLLLVGAVLRLAFLRGPSGPGLVAAAYLPYLMLDVPSAVPQGIPVLGLWIGLAEVLRNPTADGLDAGEDGQQPEQEDRAEHGAAAT